MIQKNELFDKYNNLFLESFISRPTKTGDEYAVTLTEKDKWAALQKLTIRNIPSNSILLKLDAYSKFSIGNQLSTIINNEKDVFSCCDNLLITLTENKLYLIFVEMKSENFKPSAIKKQFKGATCFLDYCNAILEHFYDMQSIKTFAFEFRYNLVTTKTIAKRPINNDFKSIKKTPDNYGKHSVTIDNKSAAISFSALK
jgi:hypothetical protein